MKKKFLLFLLILMSFVCNFTNASIADTYNWTDHPMEVGVADANPDVVDECLMHLKYDNAGGVVKLNALGSTSSNATLPANEITTADFTGTPSVTLPTVTDTAKQTTSILDFTTASVSYPTLSTTGTLRWSDKNSGQAPSAYSTVSGVRNRLIFNTIDAGTNWEAEYTTYGVAETTFVQPTLSANGTLGGSSFAVYASSEYSSSYLAFYGADNNSSTIWAGNGTSGFYYTWYNPSALKVSSINLTNTSTGNCITGYTLYGSNNNSNWTTLKSGTNSNTTADSTWTLTIDEANRTFYQYYKIYVSSGVGNAGFSQANLNAVYIPQ